MLVLLLGCATDPDGNVPGGGRPTLPGPELAVAIEPADPRSGYDDLRCAAEGAAAPVYRWTADGVEVPTSDGASGTTPSDGDREDTVPASRTRLGHVWRCEVTDGLRRGVAEVTPRAGGNLLVLLADDIGREKLQVEGVSTGGFLPQTPNLDALAAQSVRFVNAWATPLCTPTRGTILTGRMPRQNGVGDVLWAADRYPMPDDEVFLPQVLAQAAHPVTSVLVGKWHLNARGVGSAQFQPGHAGFAWWRGTNGLLTEHFVQEGGRFGYLKWEYNVDGELSVDTRYASEVVVEDAVEALATLEPPWFLYVGLHAAHEPFHVPPADWRYTEPSASPASREKVGLMIESADVAVGRILDAMTDEQRADTTVVFLSDNGSMYTVPGPPFEAGTSKGSPYQGGVNVPFWVSGPLVTEPGTSLALVQTSDLFDTALALAGVLPSETDALVGVAPRERFSESLLPYLSRPDRPLVRDHAYTEKFVQNGPPPWSSHEYALRDARWKLVRHEERGSVVLEELFDLLADPYEEADSLSGPPDDEQQAAVARLSEALDALQQELVFDY